MPRIRDSEIKFRVFDQKVGKMIDTDMHVFGESFAFGRVESWIKNHRGSKSNETILERFNDMKLMQYTGLEDKNGREIYEGDIIEWCGNKYLVGFYKSSFMIWESLEKNPLKTTHDHLMCYGRNSEVIGNQFENPNLQ